MKGDVDKFVVGPKVKMDSRVRGNDIVGGARLCQKLDVIPAQAGIHLRAARVSPQRWIPAFAGMTPVVHPFLRHGRA